MTTQTQTKRTYEQKSLIRKKYQRKKFFPQKENDPNINTKMKK